MQRSVQGENIGIAPGGGGYGFWNDIDLALKLVQRFGVFSTKFFSKS
jgi:hypothetical protein